MRMILFIRWSETPKSKHNSLTWIARYMRHRKEVAQKMRRRFGNCKLDLCTYKGVPSLSINNREKWWL